MNKDYFYCYTKALRDHLKSKGFNYITTAKAISNDKQFWLFERTNELMREYYNHKNKSE